LVDQQKHSVEMVYQDGFRVGKGVLQYGLKRALEHIRLIGSFPFRYGMDSHFGEAYIYMFIIYSSLKGKEKI
jgi:hypothetical protein